MPPEPKLISLKEAVGHIGRSCERGRARHQPHSPFFLMVERVAKALVGKGLTLAQLNRG